MFILGTGEFLDSALKNNLGGVIFFTRDIKTREQFQSLIKDIISKSTTYPFLSIDQEGGKVERTENIHKRYISPRYAFQKGEKFLEKQAIEIANELNDYGINLNFAPCVDVNTNPNNPIIGERSFSDKTDEVITGMNIVTNIYKKNDIIPCIKHFPGHGDADKDSHLTLPRINLPFDKMNDIHIKPFKYAIENGIEMIMAAHLHCTCFDKETSIPASLSKNALGYLRNNLHYDGIIISDDMVMKGVQAFGETEALIMAINAGCNMFIYRDADKKTFETIQNLISIINKDSLLQNKVAESYEKIMKLKQAYGITK